MLRGLSALKGMVDASVFGAAIQHCGQKLWWPALLKIYKIKEQLGISFFCIQQSICLNALACCLRCDRWKITSQHLQARKAEALTLAKRVFQEREPQTLYEYSCLLSASLKLCHLAGTSDALEWADELLMWSERQPFDKTMLALIHQRASLI